MLITAEMLQAAKLAGACSVPYRAGTPIAAVAAEHLAWVTTQMPEIACEIACSFLVPGRRGDIPLYLFAGSGSGYGSGYGDG